MSREDALETYRSKRDFARSPEPPGDKGASDQDKRIWVIQKHQARNLHYDLRIEIDSVLKSWAVPKGPSTDPSVKRLATPTEDHPMDYADFEGVIPEGEYGGGTVIVWDAGRYRNLRTDADGKEMPMPACYEDGKIEVSLAGRKLRGGYVLIRTGKDKSGRYRWLLKKIKDDQADNPVSPEPRSVLTGRTLEEVAAQEGPAG